MAESRFTLLARRDVCFVLQVSQFDLLTLGTTCRFLMIHFVEERSALADFVLGHNRLRNYIQGAVYAYMWCMQEEFDANWDATSSTSSWESGDTPPGTSSDPEEDSSANFDHAVTALWLRQNDCFAARRP